MRTVYESWMLGVIDEAGYNGIREEHIARVAEELEKTDLTEIDRAAFERACMRSGVGAENFDEAALRRLEDYLNR